MPLPSDAKRMLIVDDEVGVRKVLKLLLERHNFEVVTAGDGAEALVIAKVETPDLIILDMMMPKMSGPETLRKLKADPDTQDIPVIIVTAKGGERDREESFKLGAIEHVEKPFASDELLQKIQIGLARGPGGVAGGSSER